ncbi:MAG: hypothetical protein J6T10_22500 [Methanobrevibacter sp.]|nr:hypothetical protein [Methanobrevibacter sp.]
MTEQKVPDNLYENLKLFVEELEKGLDKIKEILKPLIKEENDFNSMVLSEKEIKRKIKYAKSPMEVKYWNKVLNERYKRKKGK